MKITLTKPEVLDIETPHGRVIIAYLDQAGLSVAIYVSPENNPISAVHVFPDGKAIQIHSPDSDEDPWSEI